MEVRTSHHLYNDQWSKIAYLIKFLQIFNNHNTTSFFSLCTGVYSILNTIFFDMISHICTPPCMCTYLQYRENAWYSCMSSSAWTELTIMQSPLICTMDVFCKHIRTTMQAGIFVISHFWFLNAEQKRNMTISESKSPKSPGIMSTVSSKWEAGWKHDQMVITIHSSSDEPLGMFDCHHHLSSAQTSLPPFFSHSWPRTHFLLSWTTKASGEYWNESLSRGLSNSIDISGWRDAEIINRIIGSQGLFPFAITVF